MTLLLSVASYSNPDAGSPLIAAAVLLPGSELEPLFRYLDRRRCPRQEPLFRDPRRIPRMLYPALRAYVHTSALGWAVITDREDNRSAAMARAATRAIERFVHLKAPVRGSLTIKDITLVVEGRERLPADRFPTGMTQRLTGGSDVGEWHVGAAQFLARETHVRRARGQALLPEETSPCR